MPKWSKLTSSTLRWTLALVNSGRIENETISRFIFTPLRTTVSLWRNIFHLLYDGQKGIWNILQRKRIQTSDPAVQRSSQKSGYISTLNFQQEQLKRKSQARTRNVAWFNPLHSNSVKNNIGKKSSDFCINTFQATTSSAIFVIKTAWSLATAARPTLQPSSPHTIKRSSWKQQQNRIRSSATAKIN